MADRRDEKSWDGESDEKEKGKEKEKGNSFFIFLYSRLQEQVIRKIAFFQLSKERQSLHTNDARHIPIRKLHDLERECNDTHFLRNGKRL